ncbi:MAG: hypothetical protein ACPGPE_17440, partial [Planctomycetota bacterium]
RAKSLFQTSWVMATSWRSFLPEGQFCNITRLRWLRPPGGSSRLLSRRMEDFMKALWASWFN